MKNATNTKQGDLSQDNLEKPGGARALTNIDFLGIGKPCNNYQGCRQCFLGSAAKVNGDFEAEMEVINKVMSTYIDSNFFFYPAEFATSQAYAPLMRQAGQKAMSNGKAKCIAEKISAKGFAKASFSLYPDCEEMNLFYGYSEEEYLAAKKNIMVAAKAGIQVEVFSIVTPLNYEKLPILYDLAEELGVWMISLLPLVPLGKANSIGDEYFLDQDTLSKVVKVVDGIKRDGGPYISMGYSFGLSKSAAERFFLDQSESWVKTKTLCPAVDGEYAAVNVAEGNVYWCFKAMNETWAKTGYVSEEGKLYIGNELDLSSETLSKNLEGICGSCEIKAACLGGCRSQAIAFAMKRNPGMPIEEAMYAGQPFCRYQAK